MSDSTVPQPLHVKLDKQPHPADGSDRWSVTGELGKVAYDVLGNHLAVIDADGDVESMGREYANRVHEYARMNDDDAVFAVLADLYRTELAGGAR
ncbi:hypothetical protein [Micromonospora sp. CB01531]|uniref:hypothetical protein n=1 Tax=Micromonospora sp. CB01531 TaxID=1718947 RepID=UPI00093BFC51|nr:hypothetical protein [Micromonospora sp. CB01531]OKI47262.1 hypothetical protein A6A27_10465 [Micromonospora sp. CB01531]